MSSGLGSFGIAPSVSGQNTIGGGALNPIILNVTDASAVNAGKGAVVNSSGSAGGGNKTGGSPFSFAGFDQKGGGGQQSQLPGGGGGGPSTYTDTLAQVNISNVDPLLLDAQRALVQGAVDSAATATGALDRISQQLASIFKDAGSLVNGAVDQIGRTVGNVNTDSLLTIDHVTKSAFDAFLSNQSATTNFLESSNARSIDAVSAATGKVSADAANNLTFLGRLLAASLDKVSGAQQDNLSFLSAVNNNALDKVAGAQRDNLSFLDAVNNNALDKVAGASRDNLSFLSAITNNALDKVAGASRDNLGFISTSNNAAIGAVSGTANNALSAIRDTQARASSDVQATVSQSFGAFTAATQDIIAGFNDSLSSVKDLATKSIQPGGGELASVFQSIAPLIAVAIAAVLLLRA